MKYNAWRIWSTRLGFRPWTMAGKSTARLLEELKFPDGRAVGGFDDVEADALGSDGVEPGDEFGAKVLAAVTGCPLAVLEAFDGELADALELRVGLEDGRAADTIVGINISIFIDLYVYAGIVGLV